MKKKAFYLLFLKRCNFYNSHIFIICIFFSFKKTNFLFIHIIHPVLHPVLLPASPPGSPPNYLLDYLLGYLPGFPPAIHPIIRWLSALLSNASQIIRWRSLVRMKFRLLLLNYHFIETKKSPPKLRHLTGCWVMPFSTLTNPKFQCNISFSKPLSIQNIQQYF